MSCQCQFSVASEEPLPKLFSLERGKTDSAALHLRTSSDQEHQSSSYAGNWQLTLTTDTFRLLSSDFERQGVFAAAFIEEILDGLRTEQLANRFAGLSHQWA